MKFKTWIPLIIIMMLMQIPSVFAADDWAAGIVLGEPIGPTVKHWLDGKSAIDGGIGYSFGNSVVFYSDYLYHFQGALKKDATLKALTPYFGLGAVLAISTNNDLARDRGVFFGRNAGSLGVGIRIPIGLEWHESKSRLGFFLEFVPGFAIAPTFSGLFEGGIGARYYF